MKSEIQAGAQKVRRVNRAGALKIRRLNRREASRYLEREWGIKRTVTTLAKLACLGGGPRFQKDGRIPLHTEEWLDEWAREQLGPPVLSTSELKTMAAA